MPEGARTRLAVLGLGLLLLNAWEWIFGAFLPTRNGTLGSDWAHKLPLLLDGHNWFLQNGWYPLPWFSPSFCGGVPLYPHPASFYVSLPQLFAFFMDPLRAAHYALLLFALAGLTGAYALLRGIYRVGPWPALLGAGVFLFNGFFAHHMLIGHLEFHGFMLTPWLAALLLDQERGWRRGARILGAGLLAAYLFLSGATQLLLPIGISLLALGLMAALARPGFQLRGFLLRGAAAGALALLLCAGRLTGSLALLFQLPRDLYPLPGIDGVVASLGVALAALAGGGAAVDPGRVVNSEFPMERVEFEYGVTPLPFLLAALWAGFAAWDRWRGRRPLPRGAQLLRGASLAALLLLPVLLNARSVGAWIEHLPAFRSLSHLLRWFAVYVLPLSVAAALAVDRVPVLRRRQSRLVLASLALVVALNAAADREYYHEQPYPPDAVVAASQQLRARGKPMPITRIHAVVAGGEIQLPLNRNDVMVEGMSQLACYEPLFGFRLERFPRKSLHPGPVLSVRGGVLNLKNPACYVYPQRNDCEPGDHFRVDQIEQARRFARYRPFDWKRPLSQRLADATSAVAWTACAVFAVLLAAARLRVRARGAASGHPTRRSPDS